MRRQPLTLLIVIAIMIITGLTVWFAMGKRTENTVEPDTTTRNAVAKLTADQIVSIEITVLGQPPYPRVVKDNKAVAALRKGQERLRQLRGMVVYLAIAMTKRVQIRSMLRFKLKKVVRGR